MFSVLLPSRGRPEMCRKAANSVRVNSGKNTIVVIYVDKDDPKSAGYALIVETQLRVIVCGEPRRSGEAIRFLLDACRNDKPEDMYYFGSDDFEWQTYGWDRIFREAMPAHGLSVLYGTAGDSCNPCFTRRWVETVGLFPDYFKHFGPDTWYADIAKRAGVLVHVPEVRFSHQRVQDATYYRTRADGDALFAKKMLDETEDERQQLSDKVKAAIQAFSTKP